MLHEGDQSQKTKYCMIPFIGKSQNRQTYRDRKWISGYQGLRGKGKWKVIANIFLLGIMKML